MLFPKKKKLNPSQYAPLSLHGDSEDFNATLDKHFEDDHSAPLLESATHSPSKLPQLTKLILYFSFAVSLLSAVNVALFPAALSKYRAYPFSDSELEALPYGDARLGLERAAKTILAYSPHVYNRTWPDRIARVSRKLKTSVWGQGVQVYITVEVRIVLLSQKPFSSFIPGLPTDARKGFDNNALPRPFRRC